MATQTEIGQRIRQSRERIGLSQKAFADAVNKDQTAISAYETGKRKVSAVELFVFARALGVPVSYFYEGEFQAEAVDQLILNEIHALPTVEAREAALKLIRLLSDALAQHIPNK